MNVSEKTIKAIQNSEKTVVLTGAGISAESGVPTFRGEEGLWRNFRAEEL
ncbi:MAG: Sir2 family NAD-dependent protein deacetylase, partial [Nitrospinota bacterium]|nr:Sir2 family NAD-dependent protein deacetylase [Nitrospinota bacterium]